MINQSFSCLVTMIGMSRRAWEYGNKYAKFIAGVSFRVDSGVIRQPEVAPWRVLRISPKNVHDDLAIIKSVFIYIL